MVASFSWIDAIGYLGAFLGLFLGPCANINSVRGAEEINSAAAKPAPASPQATL